MTNLQEEEKKKKKTIKKKKEKKNYLCLSGIWYPTRPKDMPLILD